MNSYTISHPRANRPTNMDNSNSMETARKRQKLEAETSERRRLEAKLQ